MNRKIVELNYFPFAVDAGGDYFFVDCSSEDAQVYFYASDGSFSGQKLLKLNVNLDSFWLSLKGES